jgi:hypothetical protein
MFPDGGYVSDGVYMPPPHQVRLDESIMLKRMKEMKLTNEINEQKLRRAYGKSYDKINEFKISDEFDKKYKKNNKKCRKNRKPIIRSYHA